MRHSLCKRAILVFIAAVSPSLFFAAAQTRSPDDIGGFDIGKVRSAVERGSLDDLDSGSASGGTAAARQEGWGIVTLRITGYLALVVILILVLFWILRKTGVVSTQPRGQTASMDVLETLALGQGRIIVMVRVMDSVLILGQTPQSITLLEKIEGQKAIEAIASVKGQGTIVPFKDMVNSFLGKMKKPA